MVLGYVNARIILTIAFALVLTPMALVWRLIGRDPLGASDAHWPGWSPYPARYATRIISADVLAAAEVRSV